MEVINTTLLENCRKWYDVDHSSKNIFHNTVSLIISQRIKFTEGQKIRKLLFEIVNSDEYTQANISRISDDMFIGIGINGPKLDCIKNITKLKFVNNSDWIDKINNIKWIGPWTIKALKIMHNVDPNVFLYEDFWIRSRIGELVGKKITMSECNNIIKKIDKSIALTDLSKFFWRIKPTGITKILGNERELCRDDFL